MPQALLIAGMHRSGTSLIASLLQAGGMSIGDQLMGPGKCNPRGYFEDVEFLHFHERVLRSRGHSIFVPRDFRFMPTEEERERARALVASRADRERWGWKDPRSTLFLDFWHEQIPGLGVLAVYRHPFDVLLSLVRRADQYSVGLIDALDAWHTYNARILEYRRQHPERCAVLSSYQLLDQIDRARALLKEKLSLPLELDPAKLASIYKADDLRRTPIHEDVLAILEAIHPESVQLYRELEAVADLPAGPGKPSEAVDPRITRLKEEVLAHPEARTRPMGRAVLLSLCTLIAPELTERLYVDHLAELAEIEREREWYERDRAQWKVDLDRAQTELANTRRGYQQTNQFLQARTEELERWVREIEEGKTWLEAQRSRWEQEAHRLGSELEQANRALAQQAERMRTLEKLLPVRTLERLGLIKKSG